MSPRRRVGLSAVLPVLAVLMALVAAPAAAQRVDEFRPFRDLPPDPIDRSARLLGMGRLTLVIPDRNNRIELWDFARNPAGLYRADSNSVLQVVPTTSASSTSEDFSDRTLTGVRQVEASRSTSATFEAWRRPSEGTAYGAIATVDELRFDSPYAEDTERRIQLSNPSIMPVIAGRMPYVFTDKMQYAVVGIFGLEDTKDEYRAFSRNSVGATLDHEGTVQEPPETFTPDAYFVRRMGGGVSLSYQAARSLAIAAGGNITSSELKGENEGARYSSETREVRPIYEGQVSMIGRFNRQFELGVDARAWSASSEETWVYALSPKGGPGPSRLPVAGRGNMLERDESGTRIRARARWVLSQGELGASIGTRARKVEIIPAPLNDPTSFNAFRGTLYATAATGDTLVLPDDIRSSTAENKDWEAAGGMSFWLPGHKGRAGVEYHYQVRELDLLVGPGAIAEEIQHQPSTASGARMVAWEARAGIERRCTDVLTARAGYLFRNEDLDSDTELNEFVSHGVTAGFGLAPLSSIWTVEMGYEFDWGRADFGSPAAPRNTRQQMALQVRWDF